MEDAVHLGHVDHGAAVVAIHARSRMHGARRPDRRGEAHLVGQYLDQVLGTLWRDYHLGVIGPRAVPALDHDVTFDVHEAPPTPFGASDHKAKRRQINSAQLCKSIPRNAWARSDL